MQEMVGSPWAEGDAAAIGAPDARLQSDHDNDLSKAFDQRVDQHYNNRRLVFHDFDYITRLTEQQNTMRP